MFYDTISDFCVIWASVKQKVSKTWRTSVLSKNKCHIWTHHTRIAIFHFIKRGKILAPEKHCTHIVLLKRPESFELGVLWSLKT